MDSATFPPRSDRTWETHDDHHQPGGTQRRRRGARAARLPARLTERIAAWWDERRRIARTIAELEQLSDAELNDIGISRADIARVARRSARPEA